MASRDSLKRRDTEEARKFWDAVERNRQLVAAWPDWMKRGSVGESLMRELDEGLRTPPAETTVLRVSVQCARRSLGSVESECMGRVIEPRK